MDSQLIKPLNTEEIHLMVDLETLAFVQEGVFTSIAMVPFSMDGTVYEEDIFKVNVSLDSSLRHGRKIEAEVVHWWLQQKPEIMVRMFEAPVSLPTALDNLYEYLSKLPDEAPLWGNSAEFDLGKLRHAFTQCGLVVPWTHKQENCYRTIRARFAGGGVYEPETGEEHEPVFDCKKQIKILTTIMQELYGQKTRQEK